MSEENLKKENDIFYDPYILNCQPESVERELKEIEISVCLENGEISPDIKKDDIVLQKSFQGMQTVEIQRLSKNILRIKIIGKIINAEIWNIAFGEIVVLQSAIEQGRCDAVAQIKIIHPTLIIDYYKITCKNDYLYIPLKVEATSFRENINKEEINIARILINELLYIDEKHIQLGIKLHGENAVDFIKQKLVHTVITVNPTGLETHLALNSLFKLPPQILTCDLLEKEIENFDYNLSYENGFKGNLRLIYQLETNGYFDKNSFAYISLGGDFAGGTITLLSLEKSICKFEINLLLDVDNGDAFWGMILNGSITFKTGISKTGWGEAFSQKTTHHEILVHDQLGGDGSSDIIDYGNVFSSIETVFSAGSSVADFAVKLAEIFGIKEEKPSIMEEIRNTLNDIKNNLDVLKKEIDDFIKTYENETLFETVKNFDRQVVELSTDSVMFTNSLSEKMDSLKGDVINGDYTVCYNSALVEILPRISNEIISSIKSFLSLSKELTGTVTQTGYDKKPLDCYDALINQRFEWDKDADVFRKKYRAYLGYVFSETYLMICAYYLHIGNETKNMSVVTEAYRSIVDCIQKDVSKISPGKNMEYNLVSGSFMQLCHVGQEDLRSQFSDYINRGIHECERLKPIFSEMQKRVEQRQKPLDNKNKVDRQWNERKAAENIAKAIIRVFGLPTSQESLIMQDLCKEQRSVRGRDVHLDVYGFSFMDCHTKTLLFSGEYRMNSKPIYFTHISRFAEFWYLMQY